MQSQSTAATSFSTESSATKPRNRRLVSDEFGSFGRTGPGSSDSPLPSRNASPSTGRGTRTPGRAAGSRSNSAQRSYEANTPAQPVGGRQVVETSLRQGWATFQDLASSLLSLGDESNQPPSRSSSRNRPTMRSRPSNDTAQSSIRNSMVGARDNDEYSAATGFPWHLGGDSKADAGTQTVNRFKRRTSDAGLDGPSHQEDANTEQLVYLHHVQPGDTYAGITLKYKCQGEDLRKANGLWSRDAVQVRKWLAIPVDSCGIRGKPYSAPTQGDSVRSQENHAETPENGDAVPSSADDGEEPSWKHVRWVSVESFTHPIEIVRMSRRALGYFPPRRKKTTSILSTSLPSTPRQSVEVPPLTSQHCSSPKYSNSELDSDPLVRLGDSGVETSPSKMPAWMRRPGGVGSLGRNVRAPGPEKDYLNSWTKRHLPGLNLDSFPSMSILGSDTASFGMASGTTEISDETTLYTQNAAAAAAAAAAAGGNQQGTSLDRAAAAVETWIRGALTTMRPVASGLGHGAGGGVNGDLIELEDTNSEDGGGDRISRTATSGGIGGTGSSSSSAIQSSSWSQVPSHRSKID